VRENLAGGSPIKMPGSEGKLGFQIVYLKDVVREDIPALSKSVRQRIKRAIEERLTLDPVSFGKPLRYSLHGHRRLRIGDYRVVYRIEDKQRTVVVSAIKHRKDVYE
jgi:mRNA interferase RelE/StbE